MLCALANWHVGSITSQQAASQLLGSFPNKPARVAVCLNLKNIFSQRFFFFLYALYRILYLCQQCVTVHKTGNECRRHWSNNACSLFRHLKEQLYIKVDGETIFHRVQNTSEYQQQQKTAACEWCIKMLDLSCSQHDLFQLEIHKSFDCFSLPDMSFQSDSLRAIPQPGFCHLYFHNCLVSWFWGAPGDWWVLPRWPPILFPEMKRCRVLLNYHSIIYKTAEIIQTLLQ